MHSRIQPHAIDRWAASFKPKDVCTGLKFKQMRIKWAIQLNVGYAAFRQIEICQRRMGGQGTPHTCLAIRC